MMLEGRTRQALDTLAPLQDTDAAPPRVKANLGILYAATGDAQRSRALLGGSVSESDLLALTRAMGSSSPEGHAGP
jgi:Flp pilus assembly protein TadD